MVVGFNPVSKVGFAGITHEQMVPGFNFQHSKDYTDTLMPFQNRSAKAENYTVWTKPEKDKENKDLMKCKIRAVYPGGYEIQEFVYKKEGDERLENFESMFQRGSRYD